MKQNDENSRRLENIELLLKSIDYQLGKLLQIFSMSTENEEKQDRITDGKTPEMVTIKEASHRTGLSYDYLRKQCLQGNLTHLRVGNGKYLINLDLLVDRLSKVRGDIRKEENDGGV